MSVNWTEEQRQVIELRGKNLLVSAAAGSGKTAVLVERIIGRILDQENPADIDRLLENIGLEHYTPNNPSPRFSQARPPYIKQCRFA